MELLTVQLILWITLINYHFHYVLVGGQPHQENGREAAVNYLRQGAMNLNSPCDNFYGAVCANFKDTFSDTLYKFHLMTSETQVMAELIQNVSMLLNEIVDGNHAGLMPFEIYLATDYRTCVVQRRQTISQSSEVIQQTKTLSIQEGFQNKRSFREPDYTAHYYLRNWTAEQECAYSMMVSREAATAHIYLSRYLGWHVGDSLKEAAQEIQYYISESLKSTILNFNWIDWDSKQRIVKLINETRTIFGYENWLKNLTVVSQCVYSNLNNEHCKEEFLYVHPYYEESVDTLFVPLGALLPPLFQSHYPAAFKFGILGQKMAENYVRILLRAQLRDGSKNLWGKVRPIAKLHSLFLCTNDGNCLSNVFQKDERNYAAVLGLKIALGAYRLYALNRGVESRLPGYAGLNDVQLLFAAYGRGLCASFTRDAQLGYENVGVLSEYFSDKTPPPVRLLATVMALTEFGDLFKCQTFHRMSTADGIDL